MRPVTVSNKNSDAKLSLCYPVCTDAAYANCSHRKVLSNLFLWLFSKSIPLKEYYPVRSVEAPTAVCLPAVVGRNKPWSVVPSIHLCLQLGVRCGLCFPFRHEVSLPHHVWFDLHHIQSNLIVKPAASQICRELG